MKSLNIHTVVTGILLATSGALWAQSAAPEAAKPAEFPADATVPAAAELAGLLANKVWHAQFANGQKVRYQFRGDYVYIDLSPGASDTGSWRTEDGRLCAEMRRFPSGCSDTRLVGGNIVIRRVVNGELVVIAPN